MTDRSQSGNPSLSEMQDRADAMMSDNPQGIDPALASLIDGIRDVRKTLGETGGTGFAPDAIQRTKELERDLREQASRLIDSPVEAERVIANTILDQCDLVIRTLPPEPADGEPGGLWPRP